MNYRYNISPKRERKDNKDFYNGGGGGNVHSVRIPSKKRKTAWKRFNKLFYYSELLGCWRAKSWGII